MHRFATDGFPIENRGLALLRCIAGDIFVRSFPEAALNYISPPKVNLSEPPASNRSASSAGKCRTSGFSHDGSCGQGQNEAKQRDRFLLCRLHSEGFEQR